MQVNVFMWLQEDTDSLRMIQGPPEVLFNFEDCHTTDCLTIGPFWIFGRSAGSEKSKKLRGRIQAIQYHEPGGLLAGGGLCILTKKKDPSMAQCSSCGTPLSGDPKFCPSCGTPVKSAEPVHENQAQMKSGPNPKRIVFVVSIILVGLALFVYYIIPSTHAVIQTQPVVAEPSDYGSAAITMTPIPFREESGDLVFSLDDVKQHKLVRFEYTGGKTPRAVMAYLGTDGRLVTAISVSEHCGSTEFEIKENKIFCARCPSNWDMMTMEAYACCAQYYPDPIPSKVVGNEVHITTAVVENWAGRL